MNARKFTSSPNQEESHELLDKAKIIPPKREI